MIWPLYESYGITIAQLTEVFMFVSVFTWWCLHCLALRDHCCWSQSLPRQRGSAVLARHRAGFVYLPRPQDTTTSSASYRTYFHGKGGFKEPSSPSFITQPPTESSSPKRRCCSTGAAWPRGSFSSPISSSRPRTACYLPASRVSPSSKAACRRTWPGPLPRPRPRSTARV